MELNINQIGYCYYMKNQNSKSVIIIGPGLRRLSAAVRLAHIGYDVTVI